MCEDEPRAGRGQAAVSMCGAHVRLACAARMCGARLGGMCGSHVRSPVVGHMRLACAECVFG